MPRTAAVVGATGLVGRAIVDALLEDAAYTKVIAVVRRDMGRGHDKLETRVVDFDALAPGSIEVDDAYCALGTTIKAAGSRDAFRKVDFDYVVAFAAAARPAASRFGLVTAIGADAGSSIFYNRVKGEAEEAVKGAGFAGTYVVRPSFLEGDREERRVGEAIGIAFASVLGAIPIAPLRRIRPVRAIDVARALVALVKRGEPGAHVLSSDRIAAVAAGEAP